MVILDYKVARKLYSKHIDNSVLRMLGDINRVYLKFAAKISSVSAQSTVSSGRKTTDTQTDIRLVVLFG